MDNVLKRKAFFRKVLASVRMLLRIIHEGLKLLGIDPVRLYKTVRGVPLYARDFLEYKRQESVIGKEFPCGMPIPCFDDRAEEPGRATGHYFHQDLLMACRVFINNPAHHVDVGSRIDGFVAHVASFRQIEVFDIRELKCDVLNMTFRRVDMMDKNFDLADYCDSISCLHVLEHFGLGRYGDRIDYHGHLLGFRNIYKMLKPKGKFYFSVPMGPQRVEFNGQRVFSLQYLLDMFKDKYRIDSFAYVNDAGELIQNAEMDRKSVESNFSSRLGCGIFELTKL